MFILPPNYIKEINQNINEIYTNLAKSLHYQINQKLHLPNEANFNYKHSLKKSSKNMKKTEELIRFQVDESKLHPLVSGDRKSTRLNSSHVAISYAVFCLKKKHIAYRRAPEPE